MSRTRRSFTPAFKAEVALQALRGEKSQAALCREHNLSPDLICRWKQTVEDQAPQLFANASAAEADHDRLAELERLVGQLTLELSAAQKLSSILPLRSPQKREVIARLAEAFPVDLLCGLLDCPRSSYDYKEALDDVSVRDAIEQIAADFPRYGYRRVTVELARRGTPVNYKRVLRIMREESLLVSVKRYLRPTYKRHELPRYPNLIRNVTVQRANQVWASDFTYIRLRNEWVYLAVILDLFTRSIRGWHLGRDMTERLVTTALEKALTAHPAPTIHHSDQGVQYCASGYVTTLQQAGVQVSMSAAGRPTDNAFVERVIRTLKDEEVSLNEYTDFADAQQRIGRFLDDVYNTKRVHSALGYQTPAEYEAAQRVLPENSD